MESKSSDSETLACCTFRATETDTLRHTRTHHPHSNAFLEFTATAIKGMPESRRPHFTQYFEAVSFSSARRSASSSHSHTIFARAGPFAVIAWLVQGRKRFAPCLQGSRKREGFKQAFSHQHSHISILIEVGLREIAQVRFCGNYTVTRFSFASRFSRLLFLLPPRDARRGKMGAAHEWGHLSVEQ